MASEVDDAKSTRTWFNARSRRTEAMPKASLFGSSLEMKDEDQLKQMQQLDLDQYEGSVITETGKRRRQPPKLPQRLRENLPGEDILNQTKDQYAKQHLQTTRARNMMNMLEEKSKYFAVQVIPDPEARDKGDTKKGQWNYTKKDLEGAEEVNNIGYDGRSYDHEKNAIKPPVHQYSLIGDIFKGGMDFNRDTLSREAENFPTEAYLQNRHAKRRPHPPRAPPERISASAPPAAMDLPPNIRHLFGTKVCSSVLSDSDKVRKTIDNQEHMRNAFYRKRAEKPAREVAIDKADPQYDALGLALRNNMFPGYTHDHKRSLTKSVYTKDVHKNRVPDPDEHRYLRDELSTWAEQNVLRERMKKAWDTYLADLVKA